MNLSKLFKNFVKENKNNFILLIINIICISGLKLPLPYFSKIIIDNILIQKDVRIIPVVIFTFVIIVLCQIILGRENAKQTAIFFQNFIYNIRHKLFRLNVERYPYIKDDRISYLQTLMVSDVENLSNNYLNIVNTFFSSAILLVSYLVIIFSIDFQLAVICILFIPPYIAWTIYISNKIKRYSEESQQKRQTLLNTSNHFFNNLVPIHIYSYFNEVTEEFDEVNKQNREVNKKIINNQSFFNIVSVTIITLATFIPLFFGVYFVLENKLTVGKLMAFNGYTASLFTPLTSLINLLVLFKTSEIYETRILQAFDIDELKFITEISENENEIGRILEVRNFILYNERGEIIIKASDFTLSSKECIQIKGTNGIGKSLFLKSIVGLYKNYSGGIFFQGENICQQSIETISKKIVYVDNMQGVVLKNLMEEFESIESNREQIKEILNEFGIDNNMTSEPFFYTDREYLNKNISTGELQMIRLARALLMKPEILILDEAFSNISQTKVSEIMDKMKKIVPNMSIILVEHHLNTTLLVDRVVTISNQEIHE